MRASCLPLSLCLALAGCFSEPDPSGAASDDGGDDSSGGDAADDASDGGDDDGNSDDDGGEDDGGEDDSSTGEPGDGYSDDVLDALDLPWPPDNYSDLDLPDHFLTPGVQALDNTPDDNPVTDAGATLGRVLFYDVNLSANATVSCATCHGQETGFSDTDRLSEGFEGGLTGRNSMGLANSRYYAPGHFFWDERANTLEDQVLLPIQDATEMGMTLEGLVEVVEAQPYYGELFTYAFGDDEVTTERISLALAQFVRSIVSYQSPYDEGLQMAGGDVVAPFPNFSAEQNLGKQLFFSPAGNCAICHVGIDGPPPPPGMLPDNGAVFFPVESINNGLDAMPDDEGAGAGAFKSPSLRNIALTGPYMHDGRFDTLADVIEHYDNGVQGGPATDPRLQPGGQPQNLGLSEPEKAALVAFLETLTDEALLADPKFADPFKGG